MVRATHSRIGKDVNTTHSRIVGKMVRSTHNRIGKRVHATHRRIGKKVRSTRVSKSPNEVRVRATHTLQEIRWNMLCDNHGDIIDHIKRNPSKIFAYNKDSRKNIFHILVESEGVNFSIFKEYLTLFNNINEKYLLCRVNLFDERDIDGYNVFDKILVHRGIGNAHTAPPDKDEKLVEWASSHFVDGYPPKP